MNEDHSTCDMFATHRQSFRMLLPFRGWLGLDRMSH